VSLEERGTEANRFNAAFDARLDACLFSQAFAPETQFADRSKAQAHCLALEGSPLDRIKRGIEPVRLCASLFQAHLTIDTVSWVFL
jgi:hypothetical protein